MGQVTSSSKSKEKSRELQQEQSRERISKDSISDKIDNTTKRTSSVAQHHDNSSSATFYDNDSLDLNEEFFRDAALLAGANQQYFTPALLFCNSYYYDSPKLRTVNVYLSYLRQLSKKYKEVLLENISLNLLFNSVGNATIQNLAFISTYRENTLITQELDAAILCRIFSPPSLKVTSPLQQSTSGTNFDCSVECIKLRWINLVGKIDNFQKLSQVISSPCLKNLKIFHFDCVDDDNGNQNNFRNWSLLMNALMSHSNIEEICISTFLPLKSRNTNPAFFSPTSLKTKEQNSKVEKLYFKHLNLNDEHISAIVRRANNHEVKSCSNRYTYNQLNSLNLRGNHITDKGIQVLVVHNPSFFNNLKFLDLSDNQIITNESVMLIAKALSTPQCQPQQTKRCKNYHSCPQLQYLKLENNSITHQGYQALLNALECYHNCTLLELSINNDANSTNNDEIRQINNVDEDAIAEEHIDMGNNVDDDNAFLYTTNTDNIDAAGTSAEAYQEYQQQTLSISGTNHLNFQGDPIDLIICKINFYCELNRLGRKYLLKKSSQQRHEQIQKHRGEQQQQQRQNHDHLIHALALLSQNNSDLRYRYYFLRNDPSIFFEN